MNHSDVHFCLVSKQPLHVLIPLLSDPGRPKAVVLFISADMKTIASRLAVGITSLGCRVDEVHDVSPYEIEAIREAVIQKLIEYDGTTVALNATGGTKVMALGAYDVFRQMEKPVFYVDTDNCRLIHLHPGPATDPLPSVINVKTYLRGYGYLVKGESPCAIRPECRPLTEYLVRKAASLAPAIGTLNYYAFQAEGSCRVAVADPVRPDLRQLLAMLQEKGLLVFREENEIVFRDEQARAFVNGGWLEDHVAAVALDLKKEGLIHDFRKNVVVESGGGNTNELDLAFTAHNKLHLVECKTKRLDGGRGADDVAYKLDTLTDLMGGTFGKAMLVTYRRLENHDFRRCAESGIEVVQGRRIGHLKQGLHDWIGRR